MATKAVAGSMARDTRSSSLHRSGLGVFRSLGMGSKESGDENWNDECSPGGNDNHRESKGTIGKISWEHRVHHHTHEPHEACKPCGAKENKAINRNHLQCVRGGFVAGAVSNAAPHHDWWEHDVVIAGALIYDAKTAERNERDIQEHKPLCRDVGTVGLKVALAVETRSDALKGKCHVAFWMTRAIRLTPDVSDCGVRRETCTVRERRWQEAWLVTHGAVRFTDLVRPRSHAPSESPSSHNHN